MAKCTICGKKLSIKGNHLKLKCMPGGDTPEESKIIDEVYCSACSQKYTNKKGGRIMAKTKQEKPKVDKTGRKEYYEFKKELRTVIKQLSVDKVGYSERIGKVKEFVDSKA